MAITKTINIKSITYAAQTSKANGDPMDEPHCLWIESQVIIDDPELVGDPHFPIKSNRTYRLYQDSDITEEPQIVQDIWNVVFTTHGKVSPASIRRVGPDDTGVNGLNV